MELIVGTKSICSSCGIEIIWNGKYWEHVGANLRHPAKPK